MKPFHLFLNAALFVLPFQPTFSEPATEAHPISFTTLAVRKGDTKGIFVDTAPDGENPVELTFSMYRRSKPVSYSGTFPILFYRLVSSPEPESPPIKVVVGSFSPQPESTVTEWLLFVDPIPDPEPNGPLFRILGMDDSIEAFPENHGIIFNATTIPFTGVVDDDLHKVLPGPSAPFALETSTRTALAIQREGTPVVVFENTFAFRRGTRTIIVIRPPTREGSIRVEGRLIQETVSPENGPP